jgi:hypothetical protein
VTRFSPGAFLFGANGVGGASARAGTTIDAIVGVDNINITCRNCLDRTFVDAGTACGAQIGIDFVSHCLFDFLLNHRAKIDIFSYIYKIMKKFCISSGDAMIYNAPRRQVDLCQNTFLTIAAMLSVRPIE